mgnify:FL=1
MDRRTSDGQRLGVRARKNQIPRAQRAFVRKTRGAGSKVSAPDTVAGTIECIARRRGSLRTKRSRGLQRTQYSPTQCVTMQYATMHCRPVRLQRTFVHNRPLRSFLPERLQAFLDAIHCRFEVFHGRSVRDAESVWSTEGRSRDEGDVLFFQQVEAQIAAVFNRITVRSL